MGKTPKNKHGVERRRPYNYPRNAQAQTQNYGIESRNYSYSTGNVPRKIPLYHGVPFSGVCGSLPYRFGTGRGYRDRVRGINKPLKPILNRQRRPDLRSKQVLSPRHKASVKKNMQTETDEHETAQDKLQESDEQMIKNGPESTTTPTKDKKIEEKEKVEGKGGEISDSDENCNSSGITNDGDDAEKVEPKLKSSSSKEKKAKKNSLATKTALKSKHSPKPKKESKSDPEIGEDSKTKETEKEKSHLKNVESEVSNKETSSSELQPSVKIIRLNPVQADTDDSIIEIPIENHNKLQEHAPSTSTDEDASIIVVDVHTVRDSPRRSTRLSVRQTPSPKPKMFEKVNSSVIILDSDDSISSLEVRRTSRECSFAQSLRSLSGRPSLRPLSAYKSLNRPSYTPASVSVRSNISSRSVTTSNDSESDTPETKLTQSSSGLWNRFQSPTANSACQDSATDNEESTNRSYADESGNDSEETTEPPFETASNVSFRKRKTEDAEIIEPEQEIKKIKSNSEKNNNPSGLLSVVSSPMNLFTSKLRGDKSSTPIQLHKSCDMDDDAGENNSMHHNISEVQYEENISKTLNEKDDEAALSQTTEVKQEGISRRWCNIM